MSATESGQYCIPLLGADGKLTQFRVKPVSGINQYCIPVMGADGKLAAFRVRPVSANDTYGFPALGADGKLCMVSPFMGSSSSSSDVSSSSSGSSSSQDPQPYLTNVRARGNSMVDFPTARGLCDSDVIDTGDYGALMFWNSYSGTYNVTRGGKKASPVDYDTLWVHYSWTVINAPNSQTFRIVYRNSQPATGTDLRGLTLLHTVVLPSGSQSGTGYIDGSAAISGRNDVYICAISQADEYNSGWPTHDTHTISYILRITDLVFDDEKSSSMSVSSSSSSSSP